MTRIAGFEALAAAAGHKAEFLTMTAPSRFHARYSDGRPNPTYQAGNDPRASQRFLCDVWARIRAKLAREGIAVYGFRIAEPHHDATTHWHLLLFVEPKDMQRLRDICRDYLLADSGDEPGAAKHRFKAVSVDPRKGSAAGYVAKYVAKNIDGFEVGQDFEGARAAADAGDWVKFIDALGGVLRCRDVPITLEKELTGELNDYGELKGEVIVGVRCGAVMVLTREVAWIFLWVGDSEAPWTCVNNCTVWFGGSGMDFNSSVAKTGPPPSS